MASPAWRASGLRGTETGAGVVGAMLVSWRAWRDVVSGEKVWRRVYSVVEESLTRFMRWGDDEDERKHPRKEYRESSRRRCLPRPRLPRASN